jgi:hypothetical protein
MKKNNISNKFEKLDEDRMATEVGEKGISKNLFRELTHFSSPDLARSQGGSSEEPDWYGSAVKALGDRGMIRGLHNPKTTHTDNGTVNFGTLERVQPGDLGRLLGGMEPLGATPYSTDSPHYKYTEAQDFTTEISSILDSVNEYVGSKKVVAVISGRTDSTWHQLERCLSFIKNGANESVDGKKRLIEKVSEIRSIIDNKYETLVNDENMKLFCHTCREFFGERKTTQRETEWRRVEQRRVEQQRAERQRAERREALRQKAEREEIVLREALDLQAALVDKGKDPYRERNEEETRLWHQKREEKEQRQKRLEEPPIQEPLTQPKTEQQDNLQRQDPKQIKLSIIKKDLNKINLTNIKDTAANLKDYVMKQGYTISKSEEKSFDDVQRIANTLLVFHCHNRHKSIPDEIGNNCHINLSNTSIEAKKSLAVNALDDFIIALKGIVSLVDIIEKKTKKDKKMQKYQETLHGWKETLLNTYKTHRLETVSDERHDENQH